MARSCYSYIKVMSRSFHIRFDFVSVCSSINGLAVGSVSDLLVDLNSIFVNFLTRHKGSCNSLLTVLEMYIVQGVAALWLVFETISSVYGALDLPVLGNDN